MGAESGCCYGPGSVWVVGGLGWGWRQAFQRYSGGRGQLP